jgi:hypothetical protein
VQPALSSTAVYRISRQNFIVNSSKFPFFWKTPDQQMIVKSSIFSLRARCKNLCVAMEGFVESQIPSVSARTVALYRCFCGASLIHGRGFSYSGPQLRYNKMTTLNPNKLRTPSPILVLSPFPVDSSPLEFNGLSVSSSMTSIATIEAAFRFLTFPFP